jgi:hypothetical protein
MSFVPRSQINQVFQMGPETIGQPGVGGAADQRLGTFNAQPSPVAAGAFGVFRPSGGKYVGQIVPTDIYAEGPFTDTIDFNTMPFLLSGNVGWVAATGVPATGVTWRHTPVPFAAGTQRTFKVQEGMAGAVYNYSAVCLPDLSMRFMRTGASSVTGRMLGKRLAPGTTLTAATTRQGRSIAGTKVGIWEAATWADLATPTRLAPVAIDLTWRHNNVFGPWFALDDSIISYAGTLEDAVDSGVTISVLADVDTNDYAGIFNYASMEDGSKLFIKVLVQGPLISGAVYYELEGDMCLQISGPPRRANVGNLRVWQWDALCVPDDVTPFLPFDWTVINTLDPAAIAVV